jgi:hypothetical protein
VGEIISSCQARQTSVVAAHMAHAAHTINQAGTQKENGVKIRGQGDQYCRGGREILRCGARVCTWSEDTAGGCRMVWRLQLWAAQYALAYVMAACNGDSLRKDVVYLHLWYTCGRIVTMECEAHCWESMKSPAKVINDAPRRAARRRGRPAREMPGLLGRVGCRRRAKLAGNEEVPPLASSHIRLDVAGRRRGRPTCEHPSLLGRVFSRRRVQSEIEEEMPSMAHSHLSNHVGERMKTIVQCRWGVWVTYATPQTWDFIQRPQHQPCIAPISRP